MARNFLVRDTEFMRAISVACISLIELILREEIEEVEPPSIAAGCYDFEILRALLPTKLRPRMTRLDDALEGNIMARTAI